MIQYSMIDTMPPDNSESESSQSRIAVGSIVKGEGKKVLSYVDGSNQNVITIGNSKPVSPKEEAQSSPQSNLPEEINPDRDKPSISPNKPESVTNGIGQQTDSQVLKSERLFNPDRVYKGPMAQPIDNRKETGPLPNPEAANRDISPAGNLNIPLYNKSLLERIKGFFGQKK